MLSYATAYDRWAGVGPYYAMFPLSFVDQVVQKYTKPGDSILDPFAGRASSVFAGAAQGRPSLGIEISPVGWIYGKTKLEPAQRHNVLRRLDEIVWQAHESPSDTGDELHEFYHHCFTRTSLRFLLTAREHLDWRHNKTDRTLMTIILIDLHGVRERSFSNQMRQSRAMFPGYSIEWWREHKLAPPDIDPSRFIRQKIEWRYAKGLPEIVQSNVWLGDSTHLMGRAVREVSTGKRKRFSLLITSPPYIGISDYHRDQWLRMWMLGGSELPVRFPGKHCGDFDSQIDYRQMLKDVFSRAAQVMKTRGCVYVRTDARKATFNITREVLREAFPKWRESVVRRPFVRHTQTALFGDKTDKPGEKDILLFGPRW